MIPHNAPSCHGNSLPEIALIMAGFLSEVISLFSKKDFFRNAAFYLLLLGALGAIVAWLTGNAAGEGIEDGPLMNPIELHEQFATITLWLAVITASFRAGILYFKETRFWARLYRSVVVYCAGWCSSKNRVSGRTIGLPPRRRGGTDPA